MPRRLRALLAAFSMAALAAAAISAQFEFGSLVIGDPWSRPTTAAVPVGVAYLSITNKGKQPDALLGASTPAAESVQFHQTVTVNDMTGMRPLPVIDIAPGATLNAAPGGVHLMLLGLKAPLVAGQSVPLTLEFRVAGKVTVALSVEAR